MNEKQNSLGDETRRAEMLEVDSTRGGDTTDIGAGKKTVLYGFGLITLAVVIVFIVLVLTGIYNPFQGTEGVGP